MNSQARTAQPSAGLPKMLTKLTASDMGLRLPRLDDLCLDEHGNQDLVKKKAQDALIEKWSHAFTIGGMVTGTKTVKGKGDKEGVRFIGVFRAQLAAHLGSAWFAAGRCHLPTAGEETLYTSFAMARQQDPESTIQFLFKVGIKPPKTGKPSAVGYEWEIQPLVDLGTATDPVQALFDRAGSQQLLAAPSDPVAETAAEAPPTRSQRKTG